MGWIDRMEKEWINNKTYYHHFDLFWISRSTSLIFRFHYSNPGISIEYLGVFWNKKNISDWPVMKRDYFLWNKHPLFWGGIIKQIILLGKGTFHFESLIFQQTWNQWFSRATVLKRTGKILESCVSW